MRSVPTRQVSLLGSAGPSDCCFQACYCMLATGRTMRFFSATSTQVTTTGFPNSPNFLLTCRFHLAPRISNSCRISCSISGPGQSCCAWLRYCSRSCCTCGAVREPAPQHSSRRLVSSEHFSGHYCVGGSAPQVTRVARSRVNEELALVVSVTSPSFVHRLFACSS